MGISRPPRAANHPTMASPARMRHLVVLQHGMGGTSTNMLSIFRSLSDNTDLSMNEEGSEVKVLNVSSNEGLEASREGIRVCGERLFRDIVSELQLTDENESLAYTELSIIGYSAGGLFARYAVGRLEECGVLARLRCASFITIATPHLGCLRPSDGTFRTALWNAGGSTLDKITRGIRPRWTDGGKIVEQLFLRDGEAESWFSCGHGPGLLESMAEPGSAYMTGLSRFGRLLSIANARADNTVPCETAAILPLNPFEGAEVVTPISAQFPHVARVMESGEAREVIEACTRENRRYFEGFCQESVMQRMMDGLSTLPWERVFAWLPGGHTHGTVIARQWNESPEQEASARSSCGQDVVAFTSSVVRSSLFATSIA